MSRYSTNEPDLDRYETKDPDVADLPEDFGKPDMPFDQAAMTRLIAPDAPAAGNLPEDFGTADMLIVYDARPLNRVIDPAEHAAHALLDAVSDFEKEITQATTLERAWVLKRLLHRAWESVDRVDGLAMDKIETLTK